MARRNELTPKQRDFISAYLTNGRNAKAAYEAAYATKGGNAAAVEAVKVVRHPRVAAVIEEADKEANARLAAVAQQYAITKEHIAQSLAKIAFSNMRDYIEWGPDDVRVKPSEALTEAQAYAVIEVSQTVIKERPTIKFKLADKSRALMDLAKLEGLLDGDDTPPPAPDEEKRQRVRRELFRMLNDMAKPEPLVIEPSAAEAEQ